jgi:hypothetical protein
MEIRSSRSTFSRIIPATVTASREPSDTSTTDLRFGGRVVSTSFFCRRIMRKCSSSAANSVKFDAPL